jgi:hypothetical protein
MRQGVRIFLELTGRRGVGPFLSAFLSLQINKTRFLGREFVVEKKFNLPLRTCQKASELM